MTRFIYDQFSKDYLEELLKPYGEVNSSKKVAAEVKEIDVWFTPSPIPSRKRELLGILGRMAETSSIFEPYRNAVTSDEIWDCLLKLGEIGKALQREANRKKTRLAESDLPQLWILTPTASATLLSGFHAILDETWLPGMYSLGRFLRTTIAVIHQLPRTPETLWLRILGKGTVQKQAIDELEALSPENPNRSITIGLLLNLRKNLEARQDLDTGERELVMRLAPLFDLEQEQKLQEGIQQGIQQGERQFVENLMRFRFEELDEELISICDRLLVLPPEERITLILQLSNLSREELLARLPEQQRES